MKQTGQPWVPRWFVKDEENDRWMYKWFQEGLKKNDPSVGEVSESN